MVPVFPSLCSVEYVASSRRDIEKRENIVDLNNTSCSEGSGGQLRVEAQLPNLKGLGLIIFVRTEGNSVNSG